MYLSQIIILYTLNLYKNVCQLYLNKYLSLLYLSFWKQKEKCFWYSL